MVKMRLSPLLVDGQYAQFWTMVSLGLMVKMVTAFGRGGQFLADDQGGQFLSGQDGPSWLMVRVVSFV